MTKQELAIISRQNVGLRVRSLTALDFPFPAHEFKVMKNNL